MEKEMSLLQQKYTTMLTDLLSPYARQNVIQRKVEDCLMKRISHDQFARDLHAHLSIPGLQYNTVKNAIFDANKDYFTPNQLHDVFKNRL